ncbi:hypothetical protein Dda_1495 [Drechslerella dactyloides]|uniref:WW domain-containing protein n=1 Tax=Drechslerella dactyloides TaxID=74499 RepID=A0AAD6J355_DREDA|nr:hypothetical protein Dda_1495 [Drechslerella dactyloides]
MASFKAKFASLVQDLRNKKSREFSRQPQPAYAEHFAVPPPPPPPMPTLFKSKSSSKSGVTTSIHAGGKGSASDSGSGNGGKDVERPPSRSGFSLRKIGSKASLKELRRRSSFGGRSTTSVNKLEDQEQLVPREQQQQALELTPPPSAGKKSPPPQLLLSHNQATPPSGFDDLDDDLYSDPLRDRQKAEAAARNPNPSPPAEKADPPPRPQQISTIGANNLYHRPAMFIPGTNSQVLPTIPASPASTMASPMTPVSTNPFRKYTAPSPKFADISEDPFKPISPIIETRSVVSTPRLDTELGFDTDPQTASPTTTTKALMNGLNFSFAPPPVDPLPPIPTTTPLAEKPDDIPDTQAPVAATKPSIKAIAPPTASSGPTPLSLERTLSGKTPQFKKAPSGKTAIPDNFAPPPPPPMTLPAGWTARWDAKEGKFAYYQGTRSRTEQWDMRKCSPYIKFHIYISCYISYKSLSRRTNVDLRQYSNRAREEAVDARPPNAQEEGSARYHCRPALLRGSQQSYDPEAGDGDDDDNIQDIKFTSLSHLHTII